MTGKLIIYFIFIVFLSACGAGSESSPGAPSLTFVSSNLDQFGNTEIPNNIPEIVVQVAEDLEPGSINRQTVHLMAGASTTNLHNVSDDPDAALDPLPVNTGTMDTIEGNVRYDPQTRSIIFEPLTKLSMGTTYHIRIHNVQLKDGRKVTVEPTGDSNQTGVVQFNFSTAHEHEVLRTQYGKEGETLSYVAFDVVDNVIISRTHYNKNKEVRLILKYNQPLPSGRMASLIYLDNNNEITQYYYDIIENGVNIATLRAKDAGLDTIWGTDDDYIASWSQPKQTHLTHQLTYNYSLIDKSVLSTWTGINNPDFQLSSIYLTEHAGLNFQHRNVFYRSLGLNGELDIDPATGDITAIDDEITLWHTGDFENGKRVRSWSLKGTALANDTGRGSDGILFTSDDIATGLTTLEYYPEIPGSATSGLLKRVVTYYNSSFSAPQSEWFIDPQKTIVNPSVSLHSYTVYNYDPVTGTKIDTVRYVAGANGAIDTDQDRSNGTADDRVVQRRIYSINANVHGASAM